MKKGLRFVALLLAALMIVGFVVSSISMAYAQDEWDKDVYAYGAGLNQAQIDETAQLLGIGNMDAVNKVSVGAEDLYKYLKMSGNDASMISSIFVKKTAEDSGTSVIITTPQNITKVTDVEYSNAAITAGITDAEIYVGAVRPVTGTSALTGVYKAFELNGVNLDEGRVAVANEELETVNAIVQQHKEKEDFSSEKINAVVADVKEKLIDRKDETNEKATKEEITQIIQNSVQEFNLGDIITQVNIENLAVYFQNFQNTSAIDSQELKEQVKKLGGNLRGKLQGVLDNSDDLVDSAKEFINREETKGFLSSLAEMISNFFQKIADFFKN